jgi:hypothetical protein
MFTNVVVPPDTLHGTACPADLNLLKHDKPLAAANGAAAAPHLKHLPAYLRDPTVQGRSFVGNSGEGLAAVQGLGEQGCPWAAQKWSGAASQSD